MTLRDFEGNFGVFNILEAILRRVYFPQLFVQVILELRALTQSGPRTTKRRLKFRISLLWANHTFHTEQCFVTSVSHTTDYNRPDVFKFSSTGKTRQFLDAFWRCRCFPWIFSTASSTVSCGYFHSWLQDLRLAYENVIKTDSILTGLQ